MFCSVFGLFAIIEMIMGNEVLVKAWFCLLEVRGILLEWGGVW